MHGAGTRGKVIDREAALAFTEAGADVILLPAPGTVPGLREEELAAIITEVKEKGALALAAIGTVITSYSIHYTKLYDLDRLWEMLSFCRT